MRDGIKFINGTPLNAAAVQKMIDRSGRRRSPAPPRPTSQSTEIVDNLTLTRHHEAAVGRLAEQPHRPGRRHPAPEQLDSGHRGVPAGSRSAPARSCTGAGTPASVRRRRRTPTTGADAEGKLPYLDEVVFNPIPDSTTRLAALQTGDINVTVTTRNDDIKMLDRRPRPARSRSWRRPGETDENLVLINTTEAADGRHPGAPGHGLRHRPGLARTRSPRPTRR